MTIGSWTPNDESSASNYQVNTALLLQFIDFADAKDFATIETLLDETETALHSAIMKQSKASWFAIAEQFSNEQLESLVRFFTVAEMKLQGWDAGADSPVIWLVKILRARKNPPSKELLIWIKEHSSNRFLPNGAL